MNKWDRITLITVVIMILCVVIGILYYYDFRYRECTSNPLPYASKLYEETYSYPFIGYGWFNVPIEHNLKTTIIYFNSTGTRVQE